jgi:hypothetical protein
MNGALRKVLIVGGAVGAILATITVTVGRKLLEKARM